jgi:hypothetical protein
MALQACSVELLVVAFCDGDHHHGVTHQVVAQE